MNCSPAQGGDAKTRKSRRTLAVRRAFRRALKSIDGINPDEWTPRELRKQIRPVIQTGAVAMDGIFGMQERRS